MLVKKDVNHTPSVKCKIYFKVTLSAFCPFCPCQALTSSIKEKKKNGWYVLFSHLKKENSPSSSRVANFLLLLVLFHTFSGLKSTEFRANDKKN
jgi:hypothetical protein